MGQDPEQVLLFSIEENQEASRPNPGIDVTTYPGPRPNTLRVQARHNTQQYIRKIPYSMNRQPGKSPESLRARSKPMSKCSPHRGMVCIRPWKRTAATRHVYCRAINSGNLTQSGTASIQIRRAIAPNATSGRLENRGGCVLA
jgi:hypothetical protein